MYDVTLCDMVSALHLTISVQDHWLLKLALQSQLQATCDLELTQLDTDGGIEIFL